MIFMRKRSSGGATEEGSEWSSRLSAPERGPELPKGLSCLREHSVHRESVHWWLTQYENVTQTPPLPLRAYVTPPEDLHSDCRRRAERRNASVRAYIRTRLPPLVTVSRHSWRSKGVLTWDTRNAARVYGRRNEFIFTEACSMHMRCFKAGLRCEIRDTSRGGGGDGGIQPAIPPWITSANKERQISVRGNKLARFRRDRARARVLFRYTAISHRARISRSITDSGIRSHCLRLDLIHIQSAVRNIYIYGDTVQYLSFNFQADIL